MGKGHRRKRDGGTGRWLGGARCLGVVPAISRLCAQEACLLPCMQCQSMSAARHAMPMHEQAHLKAGTPTLPCLLKRELSLHPDEQPAVAVEEGEALARLQVRIQRRVQLGGQVWAKHGGRIVDCNALVVPGRCCHRQRYNKENGASGRIKQARLGVFLPHSPAHSPAAPVSAAPAAARAWPCSNKAGRAGHAGLSIVY